MTQDHNPARVLPVENDRDTTDFWQAARRGQLVVQQCRNCEAVLHLPRPYCSRCGSWETTWRPVAGRGRVHSWTRVTHQVHPSFPTPYTIVLVELEEFPSVRFVGHLVGCPELYSGQPMEGWFEALDEGTCLPQWRPI